MKIRLTQPKNNRYYIRTVTGGLNGAVAGKPTIAGANVLCNCVGYANGRFNESQNDPELKGVYLPFRYQLVCNAENFIESAKKQGLKISDTPVQAGIMVWKKGKTLKGSDGAGHVAFVEEVYEDGSILTSESGYGAWAFKTVRRNNANGRWGQSSGYTFRGCIVNPGITDPKVVPTPKLTVDGIGGPATIRALQKFLGTPADGLLSGQSASLQKKYFPSIIAVEYGTKGSVCVKQMQRWLNIKQDGIWGKNTSVALQKELGVQADGVFGPASVKALQSYLNTNDKAKFPTATSPSVTTSTGASKIVARAKDYAWAYGTASSKYSYSKGSAKSSYKSALKKYMGKTSKVSQSDCGYFVTTCVRASGVSSSFLALKGVKEAFPSVPSTMTIVHKGKKIPDGLLQPGDIVRYKKTNGKQHALMIYSNGKIAEAGREHQFPAIEKDTKKYNKSNVKFSTLQVLRAK